MTNPERVKSWRWDDRFWLAELAMLLWRRSDLGIGADADTMRLDELHGVYRFLARIERTSRTKARSNQPNNVQEEE